MPFIVTCPKCQTEYKLKDVARGRKLQCKTCSLTFRAGPKQSQIPAVASPAQPVANPPVVEPVQQPAAPGIAQAPPTIANPHANHPTQQPPANNMGMAASPMLAQPATSLNGGQVAAAQPVAYPVQPLQHDASAMGQALPDGLTPSPLASQVPSHLGTPIHQRPQLQSVVHKKKRVSKKNKSSSGGHNINYGPAISAFIGFVIMVAGILATWATYAYANENGGRYVIWYGAIFWGFLQMCHGLSGATD